MAFGAERIEHVTIIVTDVDRARAFYGEVLELHEVPRPESFDFPGTWYQIGSTFLHLLGKPQADTTGARHFCLWVGDVTSAAKHAQAAGCEVKWEAKHKIPGVDRFFIYDPDGNRVEIQGSDGSAAKSPDLRGISGLASTAPHPRPLLQDALPREP